MSTSNPLHAIVTHGEVEHAPAASEVKPPATASKSRNNHGIVAGLPEYKNEAHTDIYSGGKVGNVRGSKYSKPERLLEDQGDLEDVKKKLSGRRSSPIWKQYMEMVEEEDKDLLKVLAGSIDITLVFTALFSAISTGFLLESSSGLKPDSLASNSSKPSTLSVWVDCLWLFSLSLSISGSLFAMLAKGWCYKFRSIHLGTSYERAITRQKSWERLQKCKLERIIERISAIMHIALLAFFIGLVLHLSKIHRVAMIVTVIPVGSTTLLYVALTLIPLWSESFPLFTPFTRTFRMCLTYGLHASAWLGSYLLKLHAKLWSGVGTRSPRTKVPFTRRFRTFIGSYFLELYAKLWRKRGIRSPYTAVALITRARAPIDSAISRIRSLITAARSHLSPEQWVLSGCSEPVGQTLSYNRSEDQGHEFQVLMWILQHSKSRNQIEGVFDYIESFPDVMLDPFANYQDLWKATFAVAEYLQFIQRDSQECKTESSLQFRARCGRFMYLSTRSWFHPTSSQKTKSIYDFCAANYPLMGSTKVELWIRAINANKQEYKTNDCIQWLEHQAIKIVLWCSLEDGGFLLCRELYNWVLRNVPSEDQVLFHSTLSWIFLNLATDAVSEFANFWPTPNSELAGPMHGVPVAMCDNLLTLCYFRHPEIRDDNSTWLTVVGLSGVLNVPTFHEYEDLKPAKNLDFYADLLHKLGAALTHASQLLDESERDPYIGSLPVYCGSDIRLYEFNSLHYCFDALRRAIECPKFTDLHAELTKVKGMIPATRFGRPIRSEPTSEESRFEVDRESQAARGETRNHSVGDIV